MDIGHFYFLSDDYFKDFPDEFLMSNKEAIGGILHDRPCFYAFQENKNGIYWSIPFSSKVKKYRKEEQKKIERYKFCNTILFGEILGHEKAFLIQNMCPITKDYIKNEYIDKFSSSSVKVDYNFEQKLIKTAKDVLYKVRRGNRRLVFPDILEIENQLLIKMQMIDSQQKEVATTSEQN